MISSFTRLALLGLMAAATLPAITITGYTMDFLQTNILPGAGNISGSFPSVTGGANPGTYEISGTLGLYDNGSPVSTNTTLTGPLSFRFTNATITCNAPGSSCGAAALFFSALVFFNGNAPTDQAGLAGVDGSSTSFVSFGTLFGGGNGQVASLQISNSSSFNQTVQLPAGFFFEPITNGSNYMSFALGLQLQQMSDGTTMTLPSSLFEQVNLASDPGGSGVPEPGTLAIVGAGIAGALYFRRRLN